MGRDRCGACEVCRPRFWGQLRRLADWGWPRGATRRCDALTALLCALLQAGSAIGQFEASLLTGPLIEDVLDGRTGDFLRQFAVILALFASMSALQILAAYLGERLRLRWRVGLVAEGHRRYFRPGHPWKACVGGARGPVRLKSAPTPRVDNPDQRLTQDIDKFTTATAGLVFGSLLDPNIAPSSALGTLATMIYSLVVVLSRVSLGPALIGVAFTLLSGLVVALLVRPVAFHTFRTDAALGRFRFLHARLLRHAEAVTLLRAASTERRRADAALHSLIHARYRLVAWQFLLGAWTGFQASFPTVLAYLAVTLTLLSGGTVLTAHTTDPSDDSGSDLFGDTTDAFSFSSSSSSFVSSVADDDAAVGPSGLSTSDVVQAVAAVYTFVGATSSIPAILSSFGEIAGFARRILGLLDGLDDRGRRTASRSVDTEPKVRVVRSTDVGWRTRSEVVEENAAASFTATASPASQPLLSTAPPSLVQRRAPPRALELRGLSVTNPRGDVLVADLDLRLDLDVDRAEADARRSAAAAAASTAARRATSSSASSSSSSPSAFTPRAQPHLLIEGRSGVGKSSLLRTCAGLWAPSSGSVSLAFRASSFDGARTEGGDEGDSGAARVLVSPNLPDVAFLPQRPYFPPGTLASVLFAAPNAVSALDDAPNASSTGRHGDDDDGGGGRSSSCTSVFTNEDLLRAASVAATASSSILPLSASQWAHACTLLRLLRLSHLVPLLEPSAPEVDWMLRLSPGEQQRLQCVRLLVREVRPRIAFLDEPTSALDLATEAIVFRLLHEAGILCVTVGHRPSLRRFHRRILRLQGPEASGRWALEPCEANEPSVSEEVAVGAHMAWSSGTPDATDSATDSVNVATPPSSSLSSSSSSSTLASVSEPVAAPSIRFDALFVRRLLRLLRQGFPTVLSVQTLVLLLAVGVNIALACFTIGRAFVAGRIVQAIRDEYYGHALTLCLIGTLIFLGASVFNAAAQAVGRVLSLLWLRALIRRFHARILRDGVQAGCAPLYALSRLSTRSLDVTKSREVGSDDAVPPQAAAAATEMPASSSSSLSSSSSSSSTSSTFSPSSSSPSSPSSSSSSPLDSVDQRLVGDVDRLTEFFGVVFFGGEERISLLQVLGTIVSLTVTAVPFGGWAVLASFVFTTQGLLLAHVLLRAVPRLQYAVEAAEGAFRAAHTRVREHAESIALLASERADRERTDAVFRRVVRASVALLRGVAPARLQSAILAYSGTAVAYAFAGLQVVLTGRLGDHDVSLSNLFTAAGLLVSLNLYLTALPDYLGQASTMAGFVHRVAVLDEAVEDDGVHGNAPDDKGENGVEEEEEEEVRQGGLAGGRSEAVGEEAGVVVRAPSMGPMGPTTTTNGSILRIEPWTMEEVGGESESDGVALRSGVSENPFRSSLSRRLAPFRGPNPLVVQLGASSVELAALLQSSSSAPLIPVPPIPASVAATSTSSAASSSPLSSSSSSTSSSPSFATPSPAILLRVSDVRVSVPDAGHSISRPRSRVLFEHLSFEVLEGRWMVIAGPSGCGKSSLVRVLGGLWAPDHGDVILVPSSPDTPSSELDAHNEAVRASGAVVVLPQDPYVFEGSLRDNLLFPHDRDGDDVQGTALPSSNALRAAAVDADDAALVAALAAVGLDHLLRDRRTSPRSTVERTYATFGSAARIASDSLHEGLATDGRGSEDDDDEEEEEDDRDREGVAESESEVESACGGACACRCLRGCASRASASGIGTDSHSTPTAPLLGPSLKSSSALSSPSSENDADSFDALDVLGGLIEERSPAPTAAVHLGLDPDAHPSDASTPSVRSLLSSPHSTPSSFLRPVRSIPPLPRVRERLSSVAPWQDILSVGEQQRLAFARLLLRHPRPRLALLDEATSAMDPAWERTCLALCWDAQITCVLVRHPTRAQDPFAT